jgi:hypothetical protein
MTLIEIMIAFSLLAAVIGLAGSAMMTFLRLMHNQIGVIQADRLAQKVFVRLGELLSDAIIPIGVASADGSDIPTAWDDIDDGAVGFGGASGARWRRELGIGMDSIAFVQPVSILGSGYDNRYDVGDDPPRNDASAFASRLLVGQVRSGKGFLGAGVAARTDKWGNYRFDFRAGDEPVSVLAMMDPLGLTGPAFERIGVPTEADWETVLLAGAASWPARTSFVAVRFIPLINPVNNEPWIVDETRAFKGRSHDLDGDGRIDGRFQVGRLQLLHSGGSDLPTENAGATGIVNATLPQITIDLTPNIILRRVNPGDRTPIFQLADPDPAAGGASDDRLGALMRVKLLIVDNSGVDGDGLVVPVHAKGPAPRWHESAVFMKNMSR